MMNRQEQYELNLGLASDHEKAGNLNLAITVLNIAEKKTSDEDELAHLRLWRRRLQESLPTETVMEGDLLAAPTYKVVGDLRLVDQGDKHPKAEVPYVVYEGKDLGEAIAQAKAAISGRKAWTTEIFQSSPMKRFLATSQSSTDPTTKRSSGGKKPRCTTRTPRPAGQGTIAKRSTAAVSQVTSRKKK